MESILYGVFVYFHFLSLLTNPLLHHISLFLSDVYSNFFVAWVGILGVGFGLNCVGY